MSLSDSTTCPTTTDSCPSFKPYRCFSGMCAASASECISTNGCPFSAPFKCDSGTCATSQSACTALPTALECKTGETKCLYSGICVTDATTCTLPNGCTESTPIPCGVSCVATTADCTGGDVCPSNYVLCPDSICRVSYAQCFTIEGCSVSTPYKCPNGDCVSTASLCKPMSAGSVLVPYRCSDGSTQRLPSLCPPVTSCPTTCAQDDRCVTNQAECDLCPLAAPVRCSSNG